ncbi:MAG: glycosyl hydrolase family 28-related protein [Candidatus Sumerlaeota bacterium]|nr:glycosyl hydrolase family 28-related protein [Candidatus Sumerlaeota bacterium]
MQTKLLLAAAMIAGLAVTLSGQTAKQPAAADDSYLRYVSPTVKAPFPDLINLAVPTELEDQRLAALGYVDVTKGPFSADPSGRQDATQAIQAAINFARDHQMVCFFPPGTYRFSDTLSCIEQLYRRSNGRVLGGHLFPNLLVGSRAGLQRPRLLLAPRSLGFGNPQKPKIAVYFWARGYLNPTTEGRVGDGLGPDTEQPNISMNQMLVNLDIVIGEGNSGAIALRHQAAEGSAIEDCTIDATHGLIGIQGGIGSGGSSAGVTVIGGRIGLDFTGYMSGTQPTPVITGFTLRGQTEAAIRSTSRQTLVAVGLKIIGDRCAGPLIQTGTNMSANQGQLTLVDGEISFEGEALKKTERVAIASDSGVYLNNVYVRGASKIVVEAKQKLELPGAADGWLRVIEYAHTSSPRVNQSLEYLYPVYADGRRVDETRRLESGQAPPADLQSRHLWSPDFPGFESASAANVKTAPFLAKGDGVADDTNALQRAIDQSEIVFLPKGCYRIAQTLDLKPRTKIIGAGQHLSFIVATATGAFADATKPAPLVRTADTADAETVLAFLGLFAARDVPGALALHWRSGGRSVFRAVEIQRQSIYGFAPRPRSESQPSQPQSQPPVTVSGHGGGNWYNYRGARLQADGAQGPLHFYQFSPQQVTSELRGAKRISIFGTKYEGNKPMLVVSDCDHIRIFGHGGNGKGMAGASLFVFERTPNFLFANGVDGPTKIGTRSLSHPEGSTDPREWHFLIERSADGKEFKLPPLERPVLYERGAPVDN